MFDVGILSALLGGILTFLAPCTLPLIPTYLGFLGGAHRTVLPADDLKPRIMQNAILFTLGFSAVFLFFGLVSGAFGEFFILHRTLISRVGGVFVIIFGLSMLEWRPVSERLSGIFRMRGVPRRLLNGGPYSAFALGTLFGLGWSPCLGPVLGTIIVLAGSSGSASYGAFLLSVYALGLAIPFLLTAYLYGTAFASFDRLLSWLPYISKAGGVMLVFIGGMLVFGDLGMLNQWATSLFGDWYRNLVLYM